MNNDNSHLSGGRYCHYWWPNVRTGGSYLCTRPLHHDGPCVDRVQNATRRIR